MITSYYISNGLRLFIYGILLLGIPLQCYMVVLSYYVYKRKVKKYVEMVFLAVLVILSFLMGRELLSMRFYGISRNLWSLFQPTIIYILIIIRAIYYLPKLWRTKNYRITAMSIKEAIDNLDLGLMVYTDKGTITLLNTQMIELMLEFFRDMYRNGLEFWEDVNGLLFEEEFSCIKMKDSVLVRSRGKSWEFSKTPLLVDGKQYNQVIAKDMTLRDTQIISLEKTTEELISANHEYENMLENIKELVDEEEKLSMKVRLHDSLGQQFTMIQSILRSDNQENINYDSIQPAKILDSIKGEGYGDPKVKTREIVDFFNKLGIKSTIKGEFPKSHLISTIFSEIIREATTNAVMHAGATKLDIILSEDKNNYKLEVANNGTLPEDYLEEGGGIKGMRYRLKAVNGSLMIQSLESFKVTAIVPRNQE